MRANFRALFRRGEKGTPFCCAKSGWKFALPIFTLVFLIFIEVV